MSIRAAEHDGRRSDATSPHKLQFVAHAPLFVKLCALFFCSCITFF
jgi:hypothetical protein